MESKFIEVSGKRIHYFETNPNAGKTIVYLHGNSSSSKTFKLLLNSSELEDFNQIAIDFLGHGKSDKFESYSIELLKNHVIDFIILKKIKVDILVGHSLGGHIALHIASVLNPNHLILLSTPIFSYEIIQNGLSPYGSSSDSQVFFNKLSAIKDLDSFQSNQMISPSFYNLSEDYLQSDPEFRLKLLVDITANPISDELEVLKKLNISSFLFFGKNDHLLGNNYVEELSKKIDNIELFHKARHFLQLTNTKEIIKTILELSTP